jgi:hypothetical protein
VLVERKPLERANFFAFNIEKHEVYVKHVVLSEYAYSLSTTCFTSHAAGDIKLAARFFAATDHGAKG